MAAGDRILNPEHQGYTDAIITDETPVNGSKAMSRAVRLVDDAGATQTLNPTGASASQVQGNVAHDAADSGNPVKVGAKAVSAEPTAVAANDRANLITDLVGKLITLPYANPENFISGATAAITDTTVTAIIAAAGAGVRNYITHILVTNSHATVSTVVEIRSGATVLYRGYALAAGGGFSVSLVVPLRGGANEAINAVAITTGSNIYASASGYKGA